MMQPPGSKTISWTNFANVNNSKTIIHAHEVVDDAITPAELINHSFLCTETECINVYQLTVYYRMWTTLIIILLHDYDWDYRNNTCKTRRQCISVSVTMYVHTFQRPTPTLVWHSAIQVILHNDHCNICIPWENRKH